MRPTAPSLATTVLHLPYAIWLGSVTLLFFTLALVFSVLLPTRHLRQITARWCARAIFLFSGIRVQTKGLEHLSKTENFILVANHASYLDGILLTAVITRDFGFVAKNELRKNLPVRLFLERTGTEFVQRDNPHQSGKAQLRLTRRAGRGGSLAYFPEGTFAAEPGLLPFHMGAFVAAVRAGVPIIPVAIRGTRDILPADRWLPVRQPVSVTILPSIHPEDSSREAVRQLKNKSRAAILEHCDEPDLSAESRSSHSH